MIDIKADGSWADENWLMLVRDGLQNVAIGKRSMGLSNDELAGLPLSSLFYSYPAALKSRELVGWVQIHWEGLPDKEASKLYEYPMHVDFKLATGTAVLKGGDLTGDVGKLLQWVISARQAELHACLVDADSLPLAAFIKPKSEADEEEADSQEFVDLVLRDTDVVKEIERPVPPVVAPFMQGMQTQTPDGAQKIVDDDPDAPKWRKDLVEGPKAPYMNPLKVFNHGDGRIEVLRKAVPEVEMHAEAGEKHSRPHVVSCCQNDHGAMEPRLSSATTMQNRGDLVEGPLEAYKPEGRGFYREGVCGGPDELEKAQKADSAPEDKVVFPIRGAWRKADGDKYDFYQTVAVFNWSPGVQTGSLKEYFIMNSTLPEMNGKYICVKPDADAKFWEFRRPEGQMPLDPLRFEDKGALALR